MLHNSLRTSPSHREEEGQTLHTGRRKGRPFTQGGGRADPSHREEEGQTLHTERRKGLGTCAH